MKEEKFETYLCQFPFEGDWYGFDIQAKSFKDAKARMDAMYLGKVDGVLRGEVYIPEFANGFLAPIIQPILNAFCAYKTRRSLKRYEQTGETT